MRSVRRRRLERKTDYKARFGLLKSGKSRLVVRKTNRYVIAQIVKSDIAKDKVLLGMSTKDLLSLGWPKEKQGSLKSLAACYSIGFLIGQKAKTLKETDLILDMGMHRNTHKSRIYAVLKGAIDAGITIPVSEQSLPEEKDINRIKELESLVQKVTKEAKK